MERKSDEWVTAVNTGIPTERILRMFCENNEKESSKVGLLLGMGEHNGKKSAFDYSKWAWLAQCPWLIGSRCCDVMKKAPTKAYYKKTGKVPITAQMASESRLRTLQWLKNGCNAFDAKKQISNPMSFWTEQDVLHYIYKNKLPIASVYGKVVIDNSRTDQLDGQMSFNDMESWGDAELFDDVPVFKTTGCKRTGCMFCGFGCHLEKPGEGRFERLKKTHPKQYEYIMRPVENGGLGYRQVIDWLNEKGGLNIQY